MASKPPNFDNVLSNILSSEDPWEFLNNSMTLESPKAAQVAEKFFSSQMTTPARAPDTSSQNQINPLSSSNFTPSHLKQPSSDVPGSNSQTFDIPTELELRALQGQFNTYPKNTTSSPIPSSQFDLMPTTLETQNYFSSMQKPLCSSSTNQTRKEPSTVEKTQSLQGQFNTYPKNTTSSPIPSSQFDLMPTAPETQNYFSSMQKPLCSSSTNQTREDPSTVEKTQALQDLFNTCSNNNMSDPTSSFQTSGTANILLTPQIIASLFKTLNSTNPLLSSSTEEKPLPLQNQFNAFSNNNTSNLTPAPQGNVKTKLQEIPDSFPYIPNQLDTSKPTSVSELLPSHTAVESMQPSAEVTSSIIAIPEGQEPISSAIRLEIRRDFLYTKMKWSLYGYYEASKAERIRLNQPPLSDKEIAIKIKNFYDAYYADPIAYPKVFKMSQEIFGPKSELVLSYVRALNAIELEESMASMETRREESLAEGSTTQSRLWPKDADICLFYALAKEQSYTRKGYIRGKMNRLTTSLKQFGYSHTAHQISSRIQTLSNQYKRDASIFWETTSQYVENSFLKSFIDMYKLSFFEKDPKLCPTYKNSRFNQSDWTESLTRWLLKLYVEGKDINTISAKLQDLYYSLTTIEISQQLHWIYFQHTNLKIIPSKLTKEDENLVRNFVENYKKNRPYDC